MKKRVSAEKAQKQDMERSGVSKQLKKSGCSKKGKR